MKLEFYRQFFKKNTQKSNFIEIRLVGAELYHADWKAKMSKLIVAFRNFAIAPRR